MEKEVLSPPHSHHSYPLVEGTLHILGKLQSFYIAGHILALLWAVITSGRAWNSRWNIHQAIKKSGWEGTRGSLGDGAGCGGGGGGFQDPLRMWLEA